jgi:uncharacterized phage protein (TIGR01671 family)
MNREIKFRVWIKELEYMATQGEPDLETLQSFMHHYSDEKNLMQYTGHKDCNGKDIYEGDILKTYWPSTGKAKGIIIIDDQLTEVFYSQRAGAFVVAIDKIVAEDKYKDMVILTRYRAGKCELIGNIYENPELLKTAT